MYVCMYVYIYIRMYLYKNKLSYTRKFWWQITLVNKPCWNSGVKTFGELNKVY